ncbi:MAG: DUF6161 domain-containing protein [Bacteroidota bacterium]
MNEDNQFEKQKWLNDLVILIKDTFSAYEIKLSGFKNIYDYIKVEKEYWDSLSEKVRAQSIQIDGRLYDLQNFFNDCNRRMDNFIGSIDKLENRQQFDTSWDHSIERLINPKLYGPSFVMIYSRSPVGIFITDLYMVNAQIGEGGYKYFRGESIGIKIPKELSGFIRADNFHVGKEIGFSETQKYEVRSFEAITNRTEKVAEQIKTNFNIQNTEFTRWKEEFIKEVEVWGKNNKDELSSFVDEKKKELNILDVTYREKLKLEAAVTYWNKRAELYRSRGYKWLLGLTLCTFGLTIPLIAILYNVPEAFHHKIWNGEPEAIKGLIVLATMISVLVYLIRVFAKMTFSSFHIERDAEEREQLTLVYLALVKEGKVTSDQLDIILQALFSRVETGLLGDDSAPTMPIIGNLFDHVNNKK